MQYLPLWRRPCRRSGGAAAAPAGGKKSVIVIGGGPGGYVAAIRAAQLGARVTVVEEAVPGRHLPECGLHSH